MTKLILILAAQTLLLAVLASSEDGDFARSMNPNNLRLHKTEKLTHLHFYWHDFAKGSNASAVTIIKPYLNSSSWFGSITMMDDPITVGISMNSTVVGQAQGIYAGEDQGEFNFLMVVNFAFKTGKYNGSTITILGRNPVLMKVREMPIVGGSGVFRFAKGYVEAQTKLFDVSNGVAIVEYNCYVLHY